MDGNALRVVDTVVLLMDTALLTSAICFDSTDRYLLAIPERLTLQEPTLILQWNDDDGSARTLEWGLLIFDPFLDTFSFVDGLNVNATRRNRNGILLIHSGVMKFVLPDGGVKRSPASHFLVTFAHPFRSPSMFTVTTLLKIQKADRATSRTTLLFTLVSVGVHHGEIF